MNTKHHLTSEEHSVTLLVDGTEHVVGDVPLGWTEQLLDFWSECVGANQTKHSSVMLHYTSVHRARRWKFVGRDQIVW